ncbi:MAG: MarR family transcriptional regulator [Gemmobacter sp.]|nr:MarR family transcriptional regulator [Gemmobacter sp.]
MVKTYILDDQIGFLLRRSQQRHLTIFAEAMPDGLTAQQFAALAKLRELGPCSQNALGRLTAMDNATISGVLTRLAERGLIERTAQPDDRRMMQISLTPGGETLVDRVLPIARKITADTLAPLSAAEQTSLIALLRKIS